MSEKKDEQIGTGAEPLHGGGASGGSLGVGPDHQGLGEVAQHDEASEGDDQGASVDEGWGESTAEESHHAETNLNKAQLRLADQAAEGEAGLRLARLEPDLAKRARAMIKLGEINFKEEKPVTSGGMTVMQPLLSDINYYAVYDALFGDELPSRPHFDTFRGMPVDHDGEIFDDRRPINSMIAAMSAVGLKGSRATEVRRTYRDWIMNERMNDLEHRFETRCPEWDRKHRLQTLLLDLMKPHDTELNREFGQYFWLSLYCRINYPGCFAPMALSLFGGQNAGKSYLGKLICQQVVGKPTADSVPLDLGADRNTFLRAITGSSVIANVGEMTGFGRGDLNKIKDFMTRTTDLMDQKYEKHIDQPRQWIVMMDGNKYEGLQRDESGNRRFYPMFVGQLNDKFGQPHWREDFRVDYSNFEEDFWQVMAECRDWVEANGGLEGYVGFTREVSQKVQAFSQFEMQRDRGTIRDDDLDTFLPRVFEKVHMQMYEGRKKKGIWIRKCDLQTTYDVVNRKGKLIPSHLRLKMRALGGVEDQVKNEKGFLFEGFENLNEFKAFLAIGPGDVDNDDVKLTTIQKQQDEDGGF